MHNLLNTYIQSLNSCRDGAVSSNDNHYFISSKNNSSITVSSNNNLHYSTALLPLGCYLSFICLCFPEKIVLWHLICMFLQYVPTAMCCANVSNFNILDAKGSVCYESKNMETAFQMNMFLHKDRVYCPAYVLHIYCLL